MDKADTHRLFLFEFSLPFRLQSVASRSSWSDPNATFIGLKGRNTTWNWAHTHLDGGSWVFQREGTWMTQVRTCCLLRGHAGLGWGTLVFFRCKIAL